MAFPPVLLSRFMTAQASSRVPNSYAKDYEVSFAKGASYTLRLF
jgi:hypothetical protein